MSSLPAGPLLGSQRYEVLGRATGGGYFDRHRCRAFLDIVVGEFLEAEILSLRYAAFDAAFDDSFESFVSRARKNLAREAAFLADYKCLSAHVPQILDLVRGENEWDAGVAGTALARDEPLLIVERIEASSLASLAGERMSQEEVLAMAEKLLMILRVFHSSGSKKGIPNRYFFKLTPADILVDRRTHSTWFRNLWKLMSSEELKEAQGLAHSVGDAAFVSPFLAKQMVPRRHVSVPGFPRVNLQDLDLYSLGTVLYAALAGPHDFTQEPPGFLTRERVEELVDERGLSEGLGDLLTRLAEHRFHSTDAALDHVARLRSRVRAHEPFTFVEPPPFVPTDSGHFAQGQAIADRCKVEHVLSQGGIGCVYLGLDENTGSRVILKVARYRPEELRKPEKEWKNPDEEELKEPAELLELVRDRRLEMLAEARTAIRLHERVGSVPQLLDVVHVNSPEPVLQAHPDAEVSGPREPVLVFEYIAGRPLDWGRAPDELELLEMLFSLCGMLTKLHAEQDGKSYLYLDWKPANVLRHPETSSFTIVDLGSAVRVVGGSIEGGVAITPVYAAPEDYAFGARDEHGGRILNRHLGPTFDLYGLAAVTWHLAVRPSPERLQELSERRSDVVRREVWERIYPVEDLVPEYPSLAPILERALEPDPARRYPSAEEMLVDVRRALGRKSSLQPEPPADLRASTPKNLEVQLSLSAPLDPFCERVIVFRDSQLISDPESAEAVFEKELDGTAPGCTLRFRDTPPSTWFEAYYAAVSVGLNGKRSRPLLVHTDLLADPEQVTIARGEMELQLSWRIPEVVRRNNGSVVVECTAPHQAVLYTGTGDRFVADGLDPRQPYTFRVFSRLPYGESAGVELQGKPLPRLAQVTEVRAEAGDRSATVHWKMTAHAADSIVFLRSEEPLEGRELADLAGYHRSEELLLELDGAYGLSGAAQAEAFELKPNGDGTFDGTWIDRGVRPGRAYLYAPLLAYADGERWWLGPAAEGTAFAEVEDFRALALPNGTRLAWRPPAEAQSLLLVRKADGREWTLPGDLETFLDRWPAEDTRQKYVLHSVFDRGGAHLSALSSPGVERDVVGDVPLAETDRQRSEVTRLTVVPGERKALVWVDRTGLSAGARLMRQVEGVESEEPLSQGRTGRFRIEPSLPPWEPAWFGLLDEDGTVLAQARVTPFAEVAGLQVRGRDAGVAVDWQEPDGCAGVVLSATDGHRSVSLPPNPGRRPVSFGVGDSGGVRVRVHTATPEGDLSAGVTSNGVPAGEDGS